MARIVVTFFNAIAKDETPGVFPCFYESFINGLMSAGNQILSVPFSKWNMVGEKCPARLLNKIKEFNPDLMIFFNNRFYDVSKDFDCPIVIYEVDSFLYYSNCDCLRKNPNRYHYIVPQTDSIDILQQELRVERQRIRLMPFFTEIRSQNIPQTTNISFIGSKFTYGLSSPVSNFVSHGLSGSEMKMLDACMDLVRGNPFVTKEMLVRRLQIKSGLLANSLDVSKLIGYLSDVDRIQVLSEIADLGLDLYGTINWTKDLAYEPRIVMSYRQQKICSLDDNQRVYNSSKIGININHIQATSGFSWRVCDVMASNACLVSGYSPDLEKLFPGVPLQLFHNRHEARDLCVRLLKNENMRLDVVAKCHEIIDCKYRFKHLLGQMEAFLGLNLHCPPKAIAGHFCLNPLTGGAWFNVGTEVQKILKDRLCLEKRLKLAFYSSMLVLAQMPFSGLIFKRKNREKHLDKIMKYWR